MDSIDDIASTAEFEPAKIAAVLERWYTDHSSIRRLLAIADPTALKVLVKLEPTPDGDETLPIWLANRCAWVDELRLRVRWEVQLQLIGSGIVEDHIDADALTIAEVSWRDS